jgi:hypothetical protein
MMKEEMPQRFAKAYEQLERALELLKVRWFSSPLLSFRVALKMKLVELSCSNFSSVYLISCYDEGREPTRCPSVLQRRASN